MIKQNVFIVNFNSLYEILVEIKENLSFKVIKYDNEDSFINSPDLDVLNSLIISENNKKCLLNKNINERNILKFNDFPLPLNKLLEIINIQLIRLRFNYQSKINIKEYELNINSKFFSFRFLFNKNF